MTKNGLFALKKEIEKELRDIQRLNEEMIQVLGHKKPSFLETRAAVVFFMIFIQALRRSSDVSHPGLTGTFL
jgi:hypothetical protein